MRVHSYRGYVRFQSPARPVPPAYAAAYADTPQRAACSSRGSHPKWTE